MAKVKKRLSKKKKAVQKILEASKDLETSKAAAVLRVDKAFKPNTSGVETGVVHKPRPDKKRG
jgi:inorganic pyrophosphatase/exopolyphosphatase